MLQAARDEFEAELRLDPASPARQQLGELQKHLPAGPSSQ